MKFETSRVMTIAALAAIGLVVFVLSRLFAVEAVYPLERMRLFLTRNVGARVVGAFSAARVNAENARLRREVAALTLCCQDVERLETENARLRVAAGFAARTEGLWLAADVLSRGGAASGVHDTLRIGKGSREGVTVGAVVVVPEGLVGRVTAVSHHTAEVTLLSDPSIKAACEIALTDARPVRGIVSGGGEELLLVRYMTGAVDLPPQSRVITSGVGGVFPHGLEIGSLLAVRKDDRGLVSEGEIQPAVDFKTLEGVFVRCAK